MENFDPRALTPEEKAECARLASIFRQRKAEAGARAERLTQTSLGVACGWSSPQSAVNHYLTGRRALNLSALLLMAKHLQFDPIAVSPRLAALLGDGTHPTLPASDAAAECDRTFLLSTIAGGGLTSADLQVLAKVARRFIAERDPAGQQQ
ncbi:helix-turn-helix domain-containing protein [Geopseudomonas aromaticivorans]